jgi:hypothetical protein
LAWLIHKHRLSLDWDKVLAAARDFELSLVLQRTLTKLAGYLPDLPLDAPIARLMEYAPAAREARMFRLLTAEPRAPLLDFYADVAGLPDLRSRIRFVAVNLFPQPEYMAKRYPVRRRWTLGYWYLRRLVEGALKALRTLPQVLRTETRRRTPA